VTSLSNESQIVFKVDRQEKTTVVHHLKAEKCVCGESDVDMIISKLKDDNEMLKTKLSDVTKQLENLVLKLPPNRLEGMIIVHR
jgi:hypothetical protein